MEKDLRLQTVQTMIFISAWLLRFIESANSGTPIPYLASTGKRPLTMPSLASAGCEWGVFCISELGGRGHHPQEKYFLSL